MTAKEKEQFIRDQIVPGNSRNLSNTQTNIIIKFQLEGFHHFPQAEELFPEVGFLAERHRHIFHFELEKKVNHDDRDVEFILFKREVMSWLINNFGREWSPEVPPYALYCEFGPLSCEAIARVLFDGFELESCIVSEDGENGAKITKI